MKLFTHKLLVLAGFGLLAGLTVLHAYLAGAQAPWPVAPPTTPMAQQNAMNLVNNQINWFQNATRTSTHNASNGFGLLSQQFQAVRDQYAGFKSALTPQQLTVGANQLAELDAGLNIIQEAFGDYETAVANGQSVYTAFANLCRVLSESMRVWQQEFKQCCRQLRVGW